METILPKINEMINFQRLLFSHNFDKQIIQAKIEEMKNFWTNNQVDHQIILAFSLNYTKIPLFKSLLSKQNLESNDYIHFDQELFYSLLRNNIFFPLTFILKNLFKLSRYHKYIKIERYLYEELEKQNKLEDLLNIYIQRSIKIKIREKATETLEEIIENDNIDKLRVLSNDISFNFNQKIKKNNELFKYSRIPLILYCIEKNAIKCFKYILNNGGDPTLKSEKKVFSILGMKEYKPMWDGYGFAGAKGNIQILRMLEERGNEPNEYLMKGATKFHQTNIIEWIKREKVNLLYSSLKESIHYENYEVFQIFIQNKTINNIEINRRHQTPLHYAAKYNKKEIGEILISKGADINSKDINYQNIIILFLIN